ncbi:MAG: aldehyde dehydrogenase family protein, partial [Pseudomonadota bacterium]
WRDLRPSLRESLFLEAANLMGTQSDRLTEILIDEVGSTVLKANYEVHHAQAFVRGIAGECRRLFGDTYRSDYPNVHSYCVRQPLGVVVAISPFNFPLLLAVRKIGWAMAAGNCVILKPSEVSPVVALTLAEIFTQAGFPPGVLNVLPGDGADLGDSLIVDRRVKKVTFTGSTAVGKKIAAKCAANMKKFTLELGGKNPLIVLDDAELDYAVDTAAFSNFMHQGQVCMTGSRVIVEASIYDEFLKGFEKKVRGLRVGPPRDPSTVVGPLIRSEQPRKIQACVDRAVVDGARLLCGGRYKGNYYEPTIVADVTPEMDLFQTECFGPVAAVTRARDFDHALQLANDSCYGLSAALLTNDLEKAMSGSERLQAGMVHINGPTIRDEAVVPFGGVKDSGIGREGGQFALAEFTELKWVTIQKGRQGYPF